MAEETRRVDLTEREQPSERGALAESSMEVDSSSLEQPLAYVSLGLTVGDGFKFGCGFAMALAIAVLVLIVIASLVFLAASVVGVPVPMGASPPAP